MAPEWLVRLVRPMNTTSRILGEAQKVRPPTKDELTEPYQAYWYAARVLKGRWPEAEEAIATNPHLAKSYLELFPQAKLEWAMNGWLDWLDL